MGALLNLSTRNVFALFLVRVCCSNSLVLGLVVLQHLLQQVDPLLCPDLIDPDEILGRGQLEVLPLLVHLVRDLARGQLGAVEAWKRFF